MANNSSTLCEKEFVGGCDIVKEMFEKGELKNLFEKKFNIMRQYIYKIIIAVIAIIIVFEFTIGKELSKLMKNLIFLDLLRDEKM